MRPATRCVRLELMFTALREPGYPNIALSDLIALLSIPVSGYKLLLSRSDRAQVWFLFHFQSSGFVWPMVVGGVVPSDSN